MARFSTKLDRFNHLIYHKKVHDKHQGLAKFIPSKKILLIIAAIVVTLGAIIAGYFIWQAIGVKNDPDAANKQLAARIVTEVGKLYDVPQNETPDVAKLNSAKQLNGQEFYAKAQDGDYVIIYPTSQIALLYREQTHKLINVDHVSLKATDSTKK